jgi:hypothetical protein
MHLCQVSQKRRRALSLALAVACIVAFSGSLARQPSAKTPSQAQNASTPSPGGVEVVENGGYPELHVDGKSFFIHSAAFFYYRIPVDQWEHLLRVYRSYGINTIDLYIPWNWHEPKEGEIDFDGHTNPRRNLRALLTMIERENFKLIARPGPEILNEWRHGGYPGWLLERPEYKMDAVDWIEGRYPPLDNLNATDAEAAAEGWLANPTHMEKSLEWLTGVAKELARYSARRIVHVAPDERSATPRDVSGPLLFVQLGDDFALGRSNRVGPDFWRYVESLRSAVEAGGVSVPVFINPIDMRVSASGSDRQRPVGVMGQWFLSRRPGIAGGVRRFTAGDAAEIEFFTEELKTQPAFPPVMIEYQAGWYTPGDDDGPMASPPENTLLSSRLLIANGIHGFNYFPLQDTYSPAGYSVPWANRSYGWDAALAPDGEAQPRIHAVVRNMEIVHRWGPLLAASHKRADFGIIYPLGAYPPGLVERADIALVSATVMRIERLGSVAMLSSELLDTQYQSVEQLLRNPVTLLPVFDPAKPQFQLSEKAQSTIVEYVRRGGTLVVFPQRPLGNVINALWNGSPAPTGDASDAKSAIRARWKVDEGEVIFSSKDFYSWIALEKALPEIRAEREADWAAGVLREFVQAAGVRPSVKSAGKPSQSSDLVINEIISNEGTDALGARKSGRGFLSVTNLSASETADQSLEILSATAPARGGDSAYIPVHVIVPPHESLLLPLEEPLCFADPANAPCGDSVTAASAEFLDAHREGKSLELLLYAPTRAEARLRLSEKPIHVSLDGNHIEGNWNPSDHELQVTILRGAAPRFARVLSLDLPTKPHVAEPEKPMKPTLDDIGYFVANALRLPTAADAGMRTYPPLLIAEKSRSFVVVTQAENQTGVPNLSLDISLSGSLHGSGGLRLIPRGVAIEKVSLKPSQSELMALPPSADGLLHSTMEIKLGHDRRTMPVAFLQPREDGVYHYRYDFDRDGADEWVLENSNLRLIISPESGGRALALVDKTSGQNLSTSVGFFRDNFSFTANRPGIDEVRARGRYGLFNRAYAAEWQGELKDPVLKLHYDAPDVFPGGASIEKSIQFEGTSEVRVGYRVALRAAATENSSLESHAQSFVAVNSFPAVARPGRETTFCWLIEHASEDTAAGDKAQPKSGWRCEEFKPASEPIELPAGTKRVEVRATGRAAAVLEWDCAAECARMTIEPRRFSVLFRLEFPKLTPGADPAQYTIHIRTTGRE